MFRITGQDFDTPPTWPDTAIQDVRWLDKGQGWDGNGVETPLRPAETLNARQGITCFGCKAYNLKVAAFKGATLSKGKACLKLASRCFHCYCLPLLLLLWQDCRELPDVLNPFYWRCVGPCDECLQLYAWIVLCFACHPGIHTIELPGCVKVNGADAKCLILGTCLLPDQGNGCVLY